MSRLLPLLLLALLASVAEAAGVATVVRAHPWLTRGLARESLIGLRFGGDGAYGGALDTLTFTFELANCTKADLTDIRLWIQPSEAYAFYEASAVRLDSGIMTRTETGDANATAFSVTFANPDYLSVGQVRTQGWVFKNDWLWLTATVNERISRDAVITARVASGRFNLGYSAYTVTDATPAPHRVYPFQYRVNAYLRSDRMKGVGGHTSDVLDDATEARLASHTDITLSNVKVRYDGVNDRYIPDVTTDYATGLRRLTTLRDTVAPHVRIFASLDKGSAFEWRLSDSARPNSHQAYPLGHAAGDKYRAGFIQAIVAMMEDYDLDGLDIDWEYPNINTASEQIDNGEDEKYGLLLRDLAEAFFAHGWELSACTNQSGWRIPDGPRLAAADFINSMAYGPWSQVKVLGNVVMNQGISVCRQRNIPDRRIVVGQAMYSNAKYQFGWDELRNRVLAAHSDANDRFDCDTIWESWDYKDRHGDFINLTGPSTYRAKAMRIRQEGFGGIMSWGYYSDSPWNSADRLSLGRNQAQVVWPHDVFPEPPLAADGFRELDSEADWHWFTEHPGCDARLTADITLTHDPMPIPTFSHTLDGAGHTLTLPTDTWIATFADSALFRSISGGTIRNLTVRLQGRVLSLADRANDTTVARNAASTIAGSPKAALLATSLTGGILENITLIVDRGAEIQGCLQTATACANLYGDNGIVNSLHNVSATVAGTVRNNASTTSGNAVHPTNPVIAGLLGWVGGPMPANTRISDCTVTLAAGARIANETGTNDSAAGAIGHIHNKGNPTIENLTVRWTPGATIVGRTVTDTSPSPWCATYYAREISANTFTGRVFVPRDAASRAAFRALWPTYWLDASAPPSSPGFGFFIR